MEYIYRHSHDQSTWDSQYDTRILRYRSLDEIPWQSLFTLSGRYRIIVQPHYSSLPLDMLFIPRSKSHLLVGVHGALDAKKTSYPRFQFESSLSEHRSESILILFDSTLLQHESLRVGWMAGNSTCDLAKEYGKAISSLQGQTSIDRVCLIGHSAGGLAAVRIGSFIPRSHAISINGQSVLAIHTPWIKKAFQKRVFTDCQSVEEMIDRYESRFDIRTALSSRAESVTVTWIQHIEDNSVGKDHNVHFQALLDFFIIGNQGGTTQSGDRFRYGRWQTPKNNKHALPGTVIPFIEYAEDGFNPQGIEIL